MYFFERTAKDGDKPFNMASHWALCPKLKEPIILFDHFERFQSEAKMTFAATVWTLDKDSKTKVKKPSEIRVRYKGGKTQKWVHD